MLVVLAIHERGAMWFSSHEDHRKGIEEIEQTKSDRITAILGATILERDLRNAIEARLRADDDIVNKLFKPSGPLGPFETKAGLGFLLNIYDKSVYDDLVCISQIRNFFA